MKVQGFGFLEAHEKMAEGYIIQYIGSVNGDNLAKNGGMACMRRGIVFGVKSFTDTTVEYNLEGELKSGLIYELDFRYKIVSDIKYKTSEWPLINGIHFNIKDKELIDLTKLSDQRIKALYKAKRKEASKPKSQEDTPENKILHDELRAAKVDLDTRGHID